MNKQRLDVFIDDANMVTVEVLAPEVARVAELWSTQTLSEGDVIRLSRDSAEDEAAPRVAEVLYRRNPVLSEVLFWGRMNRNRLIALATVLGADVVGIEEKPGENGGTIRIAHPDKLDIRAIAELAGINDWPGEVDGDDGNDESGARLVLHFHPKWMFSDAKNIGDMVKVLEHELDQLREMRRLGVVLEDGCDMAFPVLVATEPSVANRFGFQPEEEDDDDDGEVDDQP